MVDLGAPAEGIAEGRSTQRSNHELLDVNVGVCVRTTVEDVHHGNGQDVSVGAAQVTVEGQTCGLGSSLCNSKGDTENGVCAELALVGGAVQLDHDFIDATLVGSVFVNQFGGDDVVHCVNGVLNTLALVTTLVAIATLNGLECTGGGARRNCCALESAIFKNDLNLNGGVTAGVEDLASSDCFNACHVNSPID